jgi:hypothetical protein
MFQKRRRRPLPLGHRLPVCKPLGNFPAVKRPSAEVLGVSGLVGELAIARLHVPPGPCERPNHGLVAGVPVILIDGVAGMVRPGCLPSWERLWRVQGRADSNIWPTRSSSRLSRCPDRWTRPHSWRSHADGPLAASPPWMGAAARRPRMSPDCRRSHSDARTPRQGRVRERGRVAGSNGTRPRTRRLAARSSGHLY